MDKCAHAAATITHSPEYSGHQTIIQYECFARFVSNHTDLKTVVNNFLASEGHDSLKHPELIDDWNSARALFDLLFRRERITSDVKLSAPSFISENALPSVQPCEATSGFALWKLKNDPTVSETPYSAARVLYQMCSAGRVPLDIAKATISEKFGSTFRWTEVVDAFRQIGGAVGKKFIRRK